MHINLHKNTRTARRLYTKPTQTFIRTQQK